MPATASAVEEHHPCDVVERHNRWESFEAAEQTPEQQAAALERLADEYEALTHEPYEGWGEDLAYLCRRMARRRLGEPVGVYLFRHERNT
jgi:hypothetical protein